MSTQRSYLLSSIKLIYSKGDNRSQIHYISNLLQDITNEIKENSLSSSQEQTLFSTQVFPHLFNSQYMNHTTRSV